MKSYIFVYFSGTIRAQFFKSFSAVHPTCMQIGVYHRDNLDKKLSKMFYLLNHRFEPI